MFPVWPPKHLGLLFEWHAGRPRTTELHLDRPFDVAPSGGVVYDAAKLAGLVDQMAGALYAAGLRKGDRVAVVKENHFDMILTAAAAARIGAVAATIAGENAPRHIHELLTRLAPAVTVTSSSCVRAAREAGIDLTGFGTTLMLDAGSDVTGENVVGLDDVLGGVAPPVSIRGDSEPMMITHTSGTTSTPKLVVHTPDSCRAGTRLELVPLPHAVNKADDVALSSILFGHSRAYTWAFAQCYWAPKRLVIASRHDVSSVERLFESHRPTTVEATPNVFQHWVPLVHRRPELFAGVRYYMNTFDIMHPSISRAFVNASKVSNVCWAHSWGQSEVGPIAGGLYSRNKLNKMAGTDQDHMNLMGWAWPGLVRAKIVDPDTGRRQPRNKVGVILVRGKSVCVDYFGESERYAAKRSGPWWNTGDVGYKDAFGRIHFVDRAVDAIPGLSATELESILMERLDQAREVIVLSRGERAPLPVIALAGGSLTDEEWAAASSGLGPIEKPIVMEWDELPRTSTWKIRRKELRQMVFAGTGDDTVLDERFT